MKINLSLKIAIGIIVVFGVLMLGMALYLPAWYRIQCRRLSSDNAAARKAAVEAVAARGGESIPYIREWLKSPYDKRVVSACAVLEKMDGDTWKQTLPELEKILDRPHSDVTDAAAGVFIQHDFHWDKRYNCNPRRLTSIFAYLLFASKENISYPVAKKSLQRLNKIEKLNHYAFDVPVLFCSDQDRNSGTTYEVCWYLHGYSAVAIGILADSNALKLLLIALKYQKDLITAPASAYALGVLGDRRAIEPLILALENNSNFYYLRQFAVYALSEIGGNRAVKQLISTLENDSNSVVRGSAAYALGRIGDNCAVEPLKKSMKNDCDDVRWFAADALRKIREKSAGKEPANPKESDTRK